MRVLWACFMVSYASAAECEGVRLHFCAALGLVPGDQIREPESLASNVHRP